MSQRIPLEMELIDLVISVVIGISVGLVVAFFTDLFVMSEHIRKSLYGPYFPIISFVSIFATAFMLYRTMGGYKGSSTSAVVKAYHTRLGEITFKEAFVYTVGALLSVLGGAVVGPEGPGIAIGAFLGYLISKKLGKIGEETKKFALIGGAAGIASVFRAPMTALAFAIEIPYKRDIESAVFLEAIISTFLAYVITVLIAGPQRLLTTMPKTQVVAPTPDLIFSSILIGIMASVLVYLMVFLKHSLKDLSEKLVEKVHPILPPLVLWLTVIVFWIADPRVLGSGEHVSNELLAEPEKVQYPILLALAKSFLMPLSLTFGATGGIFMPLVSIGMLLGATYAFLLGKYYYSFLVAGVSSIFAGSQKVLVTSILFSVEFLGYGGFFISSLGAATAYLLTLPVSIVEGQLPKKEEAKRIAVLEIVSKLEEKMPMIFEKIKAKDVANYTVSYIEKDMKVKDVIRLMVEGALDIHSSYPVVEGRKLVGEAHLEVILARPPETRIEEIIEHAPYVVESVTLKEVVDAMVFKDIDHLYLINERQELLGIVTKVDVLKYLLRLIAEVEKIS